LRQKEPHGSRYARDMRRRRAGGGAGRSAAWMRAGEAGGGVLGLPGMEPEAGRGGRPGGEVPADLCG
jgi:hypothetical protein